MNGQVLLQDLAGRDITLSANGDQLDVDGPDDALTDEVLTTLKENKAALLELLTSGHLCPGCYGEMRLQDQAQDAWWCPSCRRWVDGQGRALDSIETPKPVTRDEEDARKLIEDLRAAGCAFVLADGDLRLQFPSRMSAGICSRIENAGAVFRGMAMEAATGDGFDDRPSREWMM